MLSSRRKFMDYSAQGVTAVTTVAGTGSASAAAPGMQPSLSQDRDTATMINALGYGKTGLAARLAQRDPSLLTNSIFNIPPPVQIYPPFLRGSWNVTSEFRGYLFPSKRISRERLIKNFDIPGFQKCSIAAACDIGKNLVNYIIRIDETTGWEDRVSTLSGQVDAFLGYEAVEQVIYDARTNPNRISIDFSDYRTRNAERIELFCNARESEYIPEENLFVCSEYIKQVTFGGSSKYGVARQVAGNYAHFWTWRRPPETMDACSLNGNLLTAAYLDPQDPLFFEEPLLPVAIYSHSLTANRMLNHCKLKD